MLHRWQSDLDERKKKEEEEEPYCIFFLLLPFSPTAPARRSTRRVLVGPMKDSMSSRPANNQGLHAKWKLSRNMVHVAHTFLCMFFAPIRMPSRCLVGRIFASELSRKFTKSALLVGQMLEEQQVCETD